MDRVPPLTVLAALMVLGSPGCLSADKAQAKYTSLKRTVGLETPEPVTEVLSFWQRRQATLNDPTRDGMMVAGLVGQVFLISATSHATEPGGDLTVAVYDVTARPQGQPERAMELYHFDRATLARLATKDERFGPCHAIFLPWPPEWTDVTNVKIRTRYQAAGGTDLACGIGEKDVGGSAFPLWIAGREMVADIAGADGAEQRVGERMEPGVGVAMADQAVAMGDLDAA